LATTRDQGHPAWGRSVGRRAKIEHRRDTGPYGPGHHVWQAGAVAEAAWPRRGPLERRRRTGALWVRRADASTSGLASRRCA